MLKNLNIIFKLYDIRERNSVAIDKYTFVRIIVYSRQAAFFRDVA